jgi:hypothetical protein
MSHDLGSEGEMIHQGCQATIQLQNINLQLNPVAWLIFTKKRRQAEEGVVVVSSARDWGRTGAVI